MTITVIITTYNSPEWLRKAVWGWAAQEDRHFELIVADDGSDEETRETIAQLCRDTGLEIRHVWHEDRGFRKCGILNQAIVGSTGEYLIVSDGDCVPRRDFVSAHRRLARPGRFLSGGYVKLPLELSQRLTSEDISRGRALDPRWLRCHGLRLSRKQLLLWPHGRVAAALDVLTPTRATWNGHNASALKSDIVAVNGFNEEMKYGGEDRELGERLENAGIRGLQIRHRAVCVHLEHGRAYVDPDMWEMNNAIRRRVAREKIKWAEQGISKPSCADHPAGRTR